MTFLPYFAAGMLAANLFAQRPKSMQSGSDIYLVASVLMLFSIFLAPHLIEFGGRKALLSGAPAAVFIILSCVVVFAAALANPSGWIERISRFLGDISFALYLLHTYIHHWIVGLAPQLSPTIQVVVSAALSIGASCLVYTYFERPIRDIRKGRRLRAGLA
jgi:peptidoglycan/LPS O-acetylase OafA/YrhL